MTPTTTGFFVGVRRGTPCWAPIAIGLGIVSSSLMGLGRPAHASSITSNLLDNPSAETSSLSPWLSEDGMGVAGAFGPVQPTDGSFLFGLSDAHEVDATRRDRRGEITWLPAFRRETITLRQTADISALNDPASFDFSVDYLFSLNRNGVGSSRLIASGWLTSYDAEGQFVGRHHLPQITTGSVGNSLFISDTLTDSGTIPNSAASLELYFEVFLETFSSHSNTPVQPPTSVTQFNVGLDDFQLTVTYDVPPPVPEPSTAVLGLVSLIGLVTFGRLRRAFRHRAGG